MATFDNKGNPVPNWPNNFHLADHLNHWWKLYKANVEPRMRQQVSEYRHYIDVGGIYLLIYIYLIEVRSQEVEEKDQRF